MTTTPEQIEVAASKLRDGYGPIKAKFEAETAAVVAEFGPALVTSLLPHVAGGRPIHPGVLNEERGEECLAALKGAYVPYSVAVDKLLDEHFGPDHVDLMTEVLIELHREGAFHVTSPSGPPSD